MGPLPAMRKSYRPPAHVHAAAARDGRGNSPLARFASIPVSQPEHPMSRKPIGLLRYALVRSPRSLEDRRWEMPQD